MKLLKDKTLGYFISIGGAVLALLSAIVVISVTGGSTYFSAPSFALCIAAFVLGLGSACLVALEVRLPSLAHVGVRVAVTVVAFLALLLFCTNIYTAVTSELTLLDTSKIILPLVFLGLSFVTNNVSVYLRQAKGE